MSWVDKLSEFSDAQALTVVGLPSTSHIDLGSDRNIGRGKVLYIDITVDVAADDGDANETYTVNLETDDNTGFSSPTIIQTVAIPRGTVAGARFQMVVPPDTEQFIRLDYVLAGTTPTVTLSAHMTDQMPPSWEALADAAN